MSRLSVDIEGMNGGPVGMPMDETTHSRPVQRIDHGIGVDVHDRRILLGCGMSLALLSSLFRESLPFGAGASQEWTLPAG